MSARMSDLSIWRADAGTQWWMTGTGYEELKIKDLAHFNKGPRLISLRVQDGRSTGTSRS